MPGASRLYRRAAASFRAVGAEQFAFFGSCIRTRFALILLCAVGTVPAIPLVLRDGGFPLSREYAAFFLGVAGFAVPAIIWRHTNWRPGNVYFLTLPVDRRLHRGARALSGWPAVMAAGCALLLLAFAASDTARVSLYGWVAPLVGAAALYLLFTALDERSPWLNLLWLPLVAQSLGRTAQSTIIPILEFVPVLFLGAGVDGKAVGAGRWLATSTLALAVGLVALVLSAWRHREV